MLWRGHCVAVLVAGMQGRSLQLWRAASVVDVQAVKAHFLSTTGRLLTIWSRDVAGGSDVGHLTCQEVSHQ